MEGNVCCIVVTHNRKNMLINCIRKLLSQTVKLDKIIIIDNASCDGTKEILNQEGILSNDIVDYVRLQNNVGGAGGFYEGMKIAYRDYQWLWLMDDDTIPTETALENIINVINKFQGQKIPLVLSSKVVWIDNSIHPMNIPVFNIKNFDTLYDSLNKSVIPIRSCSFVSVMINYKAIEKYGFPKKEYFIWNH